MNNLFGCSQCILIRLGSTSSGPYYRKIFNKIFGPIYKKISQLLRYSYCLKDFSIPHLMLFF